MQVHEVLVMLVECINIILTHSVEFEYSFININIKTIVGLSQSSESDVDGMRETLL